MDQPATTITECSKVEQTDLAIGANIASKRHHPLIRWCCGVGEVGDQGPLYIVGAATTVIALFQSRPRLLQTGISVLTAVALADISKRLIKRFVTRSRPHQLLDDGKYERDSGGSDEKEEQSFPSGHVAGSVAAARAISRNYPAAGAASMAGAAVVGLSRMLKGEHWPSDVAAGVFVGLISEAVTAQIIASYLNTDD